MRLPGIIARVSVPQALFAEIKRRPFNPLVMQGLRNQPRAFPVHSHLKNTSDDSGGGFVYDPMPLIVGILEITIRRDIRQRLAVTAFRVQNGLNLPRRVSGIPLRDNLTKRGEVVFGYLLSRGT